MSDVHILMIIIGVVFASVLGAAWVLRGDPRFNPPGET